MESVEFLDSVSDKSYELVGFSEVDEELEDMLPEDYEECFHVVSGELVFSCGEAVRYILSGGDLSSERFKLLSSPGVKESMDCWYKFIAEHRRMISMFCESC
jgi:hypothetical protein